MKKSNIKIEDYCKFKMKLGAAMETGDKHSYKKYNR